MGTAAPSSRFAWAESYADLGSLGLSVVPLVYSGCMAMTPAPKFRNLSHTTLDELGLSEIELAEFERSQTAAVAAILADPEPDDDAFDN